MSRRLPSVLATGLVVSMVFLSAACQQAAPAPAPTAAPKAAAPAAAPTSAPAAAPAAAPTTAPAPAPEAFVPKQPIEFVIFASPGGGSSVYAEVVGGIMEKEKLVPVAVPRVHKPGGSQSVGMAYLHEKGKSDYAFGSTSNSYVTAALTGASKTISHKDFRDIAITAFDEMVVLVKYDSPYQSMKDVIDALKAKPKGVTWGGSNVGGSDSILAAKIGKSAGVEFNYVAFQGGGEVNAALLGGHIQMASANPTEVMQQLEGKTMRAIALASEQRIEKIKEVPTLKEEGFDVVFNTFRGINAAPGMSDAAVKYYEDVAKKVMETAEYKKYIEDNMMTPKFLNSAETRKFYDSFAADMEAVLVELGVVKK